MMFMYKSYYNSALAILLSIISTIVFFLGLGMICVIFSPTYGTLAKVSFVIGGIAVSLIVVDLGKLAKNIAIKKEEKSRVTTTKENIYEKEENSKNS